MSSVGKSPQSLYGVPLELITEFRRIQLTRKRGKVRMVEAALAPFRRGITGSVTATLTMLRQEETFDGTAECREMMIILTKPGTNVTQQFHILRGTVVTIPGSNTITLTDNDDKLQMTFKESGRFEEFRERIQMIKITNPPLELSSTDSLGSSRGSSLSDEDASGQGSASGNSVSPASDPRLIGDDVDAQGGEDDTSDSSEAAVPAKRLRKTSQEKEQPDGTDDLI